MYSRQWTATHLCFPPEQLEHATLEHMQAIPLGIEGRGGDLAKLSEIEQNQHNLGETGGVSQT